MSNAVVKGYVIYLSSGGYVMEDDWNIRVFSTEREAERYLSDNNLRGTISKNMVYE